MGTARALVAGSEVCLEQCQSEIISEGQYNYPACNCNVSNLSIHFSSPVEPILKAVYLAGEGFGIVTRRMRYVWRGIKCQAETLDGTERFIWQRNHEYGQQWD